VQTFCEQWRRGFFRCGRPHFLAQKTSDFSKFMVCSHEQGEREVELVRIFCGQEGGVNFLRFCADGSLWTAPYCFVSIQTFNLTPDIKCCHVRDFFQLAKPLFYFFILENSLYLHRKWARKLVKSFFKEKALFWLKISQNCRFLDEKCHLIIFCQIQ